MSLRTTETESQFQLASIYPINQVGQDDVSRHDDRDEKGCEEKAVVSARHVSPLWNLVEEIRLTLCDGVFAVDVKGDLAVMLATASPTEDWQPANGFGCGGSQPAVLAAMAGASVRLSSSLHSSLKTIPIFDALPSFGYA